jgi:spore coat protein CotH
MQALKAITLLLITLTGPVSCSFNLSSTPSGDDTSLSGNSATSTTSYETSDADYEAFFAPTTKIEIELTISQANLALLQDYGLSEDEHTEIYFPASISFEVTTLDGYQEYSFSDVGVRMKGNTSREYFVNEGYIYDLVHFKISFDEFVTDQRFLGMAKIDLKWNRNLDHTNMRLPYAYKMFQYFIGMSPGATLASFDITQTGNQGATTTHMGVYNLIEAIDKRLVKRFYDGDDDQGNLYKVTYNNKGPADFLMTGAVIKSGSTYTAITNGKIGIEDKAYDYTPTYDLKTNRTSPNYSDMATLIGRVNSTTDYDSSAMKSILDEAIDIDRFLLLEAVAYYMGNPDDLKNNYNNTYVYFVPSSGQAIFMPYDFDRGFGVNGDWDPTGNSMTEVSPFSDYAEGYWGDKYIVNPIYRSTIMSTGHIDYLTQYGGYLVDVYNSDWLDYEFFSSMYNQYKANYENKVMPDNDLTYVAFSRSEAIEYNWTMENYLNAKKDTAREALGL